MNLFYLSENPIQAAEYMHDKHVVKMITESAQLLSTYYHITTTNIPLHIKSQLCEPVKQKQIPEWMSKDVHNVCYLLEHAKELSALYTIIYKKIHKLDHLIHILDRELNPDKISLVDIICKHTPPPLLMPDEYKIGEGRSKDLARSSYILYYYKEKMKWFSSAYNRWYDNKWTGAMGESRFPYILTKDYIVGMLKCYSKDVNATR